MDILMSISEVQQMWHTLLALVFFCELTMYLLIFLNVQLSFLISLLHLFILMCSFQNRSRCD